MKILITLSVIAIVSQVLLATPLNSVVGTGDSCPLNTVEWNMGSNSSQRVCIHNTCAANAISLMNYIENNMTLSTDTAGKTWEDNVDITYTISDTTCGVGGAGSGSQECFIDECFQHVALQAEDGNYTVSSVPGTVTLINPSSTGYTTTGYHNSANCDTTSITDQSTCYFIFPFVFAGTVTTTTFTRDMAFLDYKFTAVYNRLAGADTMEATLTNQEVGATSHTSSVGAEFEKTPEALVGATLDFTTSAPASIEIGDTLSLSLQAPAGHEYRDYVNNTLSVELVFTSNGTEITFPLTAKNVVLTNDGGSDSEIRTIDFEIDVNYLGTYTVRAGATLASLYQGRLLIEQEFELSGLNSELIITVTQPKIFSFNFICVMFCLVMVALLAYSFVLRQKTSKQEQQAIKYSKVQQESQV